MVTLTMCSIQEGMSVSLVRRTKAISQWHEMSAWIQYQWYPTRKLNEWTSWNSSKKHSMNVNVQIYSEEAMQLGNENPCLGV